MKTLIIVTALLALNPLPILLADEDPFRVADLTDCTGTVTRVAGLHYCYEEAEGDAVYINKYDEFFVQRGEAVIRVLFKDLLRVEFLGDSETSGDRNLRKARFYTRSGKEVEAQVLCHPGCFIKGRMDLGEFTLELDKVDKLVFPEAPFVENTKMEILLAARGSLPAEAARIELSDSGLELQAADGQALDGNELKNEIAAADHVVVLSVQEKVSSVVLIENLSVLEKAGARTLYLSD